MVWAANPPRTGVANLHPAPKTCLFLGSEAPVRRTNSDPERWGTPRFTRSTRRGATADGRFFRTYTNILYVYACRYVVAFVVSFVFCFRIALRFKKWDVRASNEARRWLHHVSVSWIRLWQVLGGFELIGVSSWCFLSAWWLWFCFWLSNW